MPQPISAIDSEAYLPGVLVGAPHASGQLVHAPRATEAGPIGAIGLCTLLPIVDASLFVSMSLRMTRVSIFEGKINLLISNLINL